MHDGAFMVLGAVVSNFPKEFFLTVSVEEKGPKCRMKIVQQRREWRHQNRVTDSGEKFWTHLQFGTGSDGDLCGH